MHRICDTLYTLQLTCETISKSATIRSLQYASDSEKNRFASNKHQEPHEKDHAFDNSNALQQHHPSFNKINSTSVNWNEIRYKQLQPFRVKSSISNMSGYYWNKKKWADSVAVCCHTNGLLDDATRY